MSTAVNCSRFQLDIQAENEIQSRRIRMPIFSIDFIRICFKNFSSGDSLDIFEFHIGVEYLLGKIYLSISSNNYLLYLLKYYHNLNKNIDIKYFVKMYLTENK